MTTCPACQGAHHIQQCAAIRELLFAPFTDVCSSCGDQLGWQGPLDAMCAACAEYHRLDQLAADRAIVGNMVRDAFGISLDLRAGCTQSSLERVEIDGELIPF